MFPCAAHLHGPGAKCRPFSQFMRRLGLDQKFGPCGAVSWNRELPTSRNRFGCGESVDPPLFDVKRVQQKTTSVKNRENPQKAHPNRFRDLKPDATRQGALNLFLRGTLQPADLCLRGLQVSLHSPRFSTDLAPPRIALQKSDW